MAASPMAACDAISTRLRRLVGVVVLPAAMVAADGSVAATDAPSVVPATHVLRARRRSGPPTAPAAPTGEGKPADGAAGVGLFPPPGTKPVKRGIVVPEDFPLPEGYVRHYQTTDDGRALPAVLMFHPDFEFVDETGRPVPLPADRIVPPEMAPPGLPIRMLDAR